MDVPDIQIAAKAYGSANTVNCWHCMRSPPNASAKFQLETGLNLTIQVEVFPASHTHSLTLDQRNSAIRVKWKASCD
jgi:hypothetical protein